jgi:glycosyltransferase involved in cell wall biosynthesis
MLSKTGPKVTVFTAVHDRRELLPRAIESVLAQRFEDFELLVLDDGSTDGSAEVARRYRDPRVRVVRRAEHLGIPRTRNEGLALARGEYLAILDSDDTALPGRLARQVRFLDRRPEIAAVGGFALRVERDGRHAPPALRPTRPRDIRARMLFTTCFKNPTMMARTSAMREIGYREEFTYCQDIDLWSRMSAKYPLANLPEFLTRYCLGGESHRDGALAAALKKRTAEDQLRDLGVAHDATDLDRHHALRNPKGLLPDAAFVAWCDTWLARLLAANRANPCYPEPEFTEAAAERWWRVALAARGGDVPLRRFARHATFGPLLPALVGRLATSGARALAAALRAPLP